MAYRATKKPVKSTSAAPQTTPGEGPTQPMSIEDLVGAPKTPSEHTSGEVATQASDVPVPTAQSEAPSPERSAGPRPYSQHRRALGSRPMGYRRDTYRPYQSNGNGPPRRSEYGSYRRESGEGYTQDINVPTETVRGMLDIMPEGHGFLRPKFTPSEGDIYISQSQIRRFLLRNGDAVEGQARAPKDNERYWGLLKVEKVNELPAEQMERRPKFEDLVPVYPNKLLRLETGDPPAGGPLSIRMIDLVAPIGFGQRGLIVSPPKAGKTTILKEIAAGVAANYPNVHLMAALIGERPEEVTDISRSVKGEVLASNFDESPAEQTRIAEVALERAKRLVEIGRDVVILLDSITRLARAYNLVVNPSGRTLSGGFDPAALYPAKRFLGAARCVEPFNPASFGSAQDKSFGMAQDKSSDRQAKPVDPSGVTPSTQVPQDMRYTSGGSLTVIGTALVETGSRMDDLIYEEFKGTGNMELTLSRVLQERRIFPAIDVGKSGTRHDELLLGEEAMKKVTTLRHMLSLLGDEERTMMLIDRLTKTKDNAEFLDSLGKG